MRELLQGIILDSTIDNHMSALLQGVLYGVRPNFVGSDTAPPVHRNQSANTASPILASDRYHDRWYDRQGSCR
jgi:hypothetical protein